MGSTMKRDAIKAFSKRNRENQRLAWREMASKSTYLSSSYIGKILSNRKCGEKPVSVLFEFLKRNNLLSAKELSIGQREKAKKHTGLQKGATIIFKKREYLVQHVLKDTANKGMSKCKSFVPVSAFRIHCGKVLKNTSFYIDEHYEIIS